MSARVSLTHNLSTSFPLPLRRVKGFVNGGTRICRRTHAAMYDRWIDAVLPLSRYGSRRFGAAISNGCVQIALLTVLIHLLPTTLHAVGNNPRYDDYPHGFAVTASARPGGIAVIDIGPTRLPKPTVRWNDNPVLVLPHSTRWHALVGLPLNIRTGTHTLEIYSTTARTQNFEVRGHQYPKQHLQIANKRKVNPYASDMQRIQSEAKRIRRAKQHRDDRFIASEFILPVTGTTSSPFGLRRVYNGEPRKPHGGHDIAAIEGTPILATAAGTVIEAGDFFFNGKSVFLDHGGGLLSLYSHMHRINVRSGDTVTAGQRIGEVGATGRVTGAHLHWSVGLNGTWVDPMLFLPPGIDTSTGTIAPTR